MNASQRRVSDALDALTAAVEDETLPAGVTWSLGYLRAWMEERIMSERTTGATPQQVEAAAKQMIEKWRAGTLWDSDADDIAYAQARAWAPLLVPPGHVIVPAASVPTEEQRAAVGRLVEFADSRFDIDGDEEETFHRMDATREAVQPGDIAAARAVAEGGTNGN